MFGEFFACMTLLLLKCSVFKKTTLLWCHRDLVIKLKLASYPDYMENCLEYRNFYIHQVPSFENEGRNLRISYVTEI